MNRIEITRQQFQEDRQGRTFSDILNDSKVPLDEALEFFREPSRQRRMLESELHHDRPPLAGVVRELESIPTIHDFLMQNARKERVSSLRFRQAVGVIVRIIMESHGWRKTGKKGSLGVRSSNSAGTPRHNTGGLAFWFLRGERYTCDNRPFRSTRARCRELESTTTSIEDSLSPRAANRSEAAKQATRPKTSGGSSSLKARRGRANRT